VTDSAFELAGRVALVTGASRGIGARTAVALAKTHARVAIHYGRSREAAESVATEIRELGLPEPFLVQADLAAESARRDLYRTVSRELGDPLILVNNAGVFERNPLDAIDDSVFLKKWRLTMSVNLESAAHLSFLALPAMRRAAFGRVVMISSRSAFRGEIDCPDYAVSKAGMVNLARCLARAEGPHGITANSICPGWVSTEMAAPDIAERGEAALAEDIPLGRIATPEDVANAVLFFVSKAGSYANGTALPLNGGSYLH
jgi:NAD(P)-dependent dehydrogenase (short-subunit alcohol dehydrogenase family)